MFGVSLVQWLAAEYPLVRSESEAETALLWRARFRQAVHELESESVGSAQTFKLKERAQPLGSLFEAIRIGKDSFHRDRLRVRGSAHSSTQSSILAPRSQRELLSTAIDLLGCDDRYILARGSHGSRYSAPNAVLARLLATDWIDLTRALGDHIVLRMITDFVVLERVGVCCYIQLSGRVGLGEVSDSLVGSAPVYRPLACHGRMKKFRPDLCFARPETSSQSAGRNIRRVGRNVDVYSKSRSQIRPFGICRGNPFLDIPVSRASAKRLASCILHGAGLQPQSGGVRKLLTSGRCLDAHFTIMLQRLLIRAWDVPLKRMLDFYCPPGKELDDEKNLSLKAYATPFRSVLRFLLRVCKYVVPTEMLTLCSHREYLRKVVRSFLECKANSVPFDSIFHEDVLIQSQDELPSYLSNLKRSSQKCFGRDYAGKTLCFLFRAVIAHTFAVCFVVSPAGDADSKRMFLRRDLNMRFYAIASNHLLRSGDFQHLKDTARTREVRPVTSLHFLPKPGGFRVIQSMEHGRTRKQAYLIQSVLMCERLSHPESFGASVRSVAEVYERWRGFAERWRWHGRPKLYAVCFDIRQAFDSIPLHRLLWHELPELFHSNAYGLRRFFCSDGNFRFPRRKWMACPLENVTGGYDAFSHQFSRCSRELILADEGIIYWLRTSDIIAWLRRTVGKNLVLLRNGEGILVQRHGVPQGLPISSLLCDFHLGQFERSCFRDIVCAQNREDALTLMIRYVDDVLFVTSNASLFHSVLARVHQGSETFGVVPSPGKTRVCISGVGTGTVEWCGMILNLHNAEVLLNTPPFCRGLGPECRDFLGPHKSSGTKRVIARFVSIFASQIQPIFVDARINTRQTVQSNIYAALNLALCRVDQRGFFAIFESQNNRKKFTHMLCRALVDRLHRLVPTGLHHELSVKYLKRLLYESLHFFAFPLDNFRNRPH